MHNEKPAPEGPSTFVEKMEVVYCWGQIVGLAGLFNTIVPLPITALLTKKYGREELIKRIHMMVEWATICVKRILEMDLTVHGKQNIPRSTRGYMYVSNHQSYVDIVVLMSALDTVAFLSKSLVWRIPFVGLSAHCGGTIFFSRNSPDERERALCETLRMCEESTAVVVFPEGTRSEDGKLREKTYPRAMLEAHSRGIKVIPVGLDGTHRVFPKSMDRVRRGCKVVVNVGKPIDPAAHADADRYATACWSEVGRLLDESRRQVEEA